jgi:hypothetical protein
MSRTERCGKGEDGVSGACSALLLRNEWACLEPQARHCQIRRGASGVAAGVAGCVGDME